MDRLKNAEPKHWAKSCAILKELCDYDFNFQEVCIMAAKKPFTESEQKLLKRNPYTYQVTTQKIRFTAEFKQAFWDLYRSGTSPVLVMRQLGYDIDLLGKERIRGIRTVVQRQALPPEQTLKRMQGEITYLRQEMELKKLIDLDGENGRRE